MLKGLDMSLRCVGLSLPLFEPLPGTKFGEREFDMCWVAKAYRSALLSVRKPVLISYPSKSCISLSSASAFAAYR